MALTLTFPAAPGPIGPGYYIQVAQSVGPVPVDDYVSVQIRDAATGFQLSFCNFTCFGSLFPFELMGVRGVLTPGANDFGAWDAARNLGGAQGPALVGRAVTVQIAWRHANNALVNFLNPPGAWTWDPEGGLGELAVRLTAPSSAGGQLERILAAVYRPFPQN